ncbi:hypothetical protein HGRIS_009045 [Hohenbuehelia grisea]|uniref:Uncharacterized protein n=1 Tax=Hohenbuehelia grisea TaxID=104357 RepID=A0ABR3J1C8_9AGAR
MSSSVYRALSSTPSFSGRRVMLNTTQSHAPPVTLEHNHLAHDHTSTRTPSQPAGNSAPQLHRANALRLAHSVHKHQSGQWTQKYRRFSSQPAPNDAPRDRLLALTVQSPPLTRLYQGRFVEHL